VLILLVVALGSVLRLHNVAATPGLYSDEGTLLNISHNLLSGRWQYLALTQSTLIAARLPLFPALLAISSRLFGEGVATLRVLTGLLGVVSIALVYVLVRVMSLPRAREYALLAALVLAIHPNAVAYSRLGFSYNLLTPLVLLTCAAAWRFVDDGRHRHVVLAGLLVGLGTVSDLAMLTVMAPLLIIASSRGWRPTLKLTAASAVFPLAYLIYMLASAPEAFLFDLQFTISRVSALPAIMQLPIAVVNLGGLLRWDPWFIPVTIGLFMIQPMRARWFLLLSLALPLLLIARSVVGLPLRAYHYLIPFLPLAAIGTAGLLLRGTSVVAETFHTGMARLLAAWKLIGNGPGATWIEARLQHLSGALAVFLFVLSPFLVSALVTIGEIQTELRTPVHELLVDQDQAYEVAEYLNARTAEEDLVIASPAVAWLLEAQVADFQQALAFQGLATAHFPARIPAERFAYPTSPDRARFVVIDPIWRNWASLVMPDVAELMSEVETWPLEFVAGEVMVYANPGLRPR
jgi:4-amino-4-deoxy-L-arabinose transferase-like glycosyltransferase